VAIEASNAVRPAAVGAVVVVAVARSATTAEVYDALKVWNADCTAWASVFRVLEPVPPPP
jgi:hypothetical protein